MVTIKDVAKKCGVAKSTVSNVFSQKRFVSPELKEKILQACEELHFYPSFSASTLVTKKTNIIAIIFELGRGYQDFYADFVRASVMEASKHGINVLLYYNLMPNQIESVLSHGKAPIDGAIIISPERFDNRIKSMKSNNIPFVVLGSLASDIVCDRVDIDNESLCGEVCCKLIADGHRKIVLLNSRRNLTISNDRLSGYNKAYLDNNLEPYKVFFTEFGEEKEAQVLDEIDDDFTAVVTANDLLAKGVYDYAKAKNLPIGSHVSVFSLGGNVYSGSKLEPPLSNAMQDYFAMATKATKLLINRINEVGGDYVSVKSQSVVNYTTSCGKIV